MNRQPLTHRAAFWIGVLALAILLGFWQFCARMGIDITLGDLARNTLILLAAAVALYACNRTNTR